MKYKLAVKKLQKSIDAIQGMFDDYNDELLSVDHGRHGSTLSYIQQQLNGIVTALENRE